MATRARAERGGAGGVVKEQFEGRVRKWVKKWTSASDKKLAKLQLLRWVQLDEKTGPTYGPRFPQYQPLESSDLLPLEIILPRPQATPRPAQAPRPANAQPVPPALPALPVVPVVPTGGVTFTAQHATAAPIISAAVPGNVGLMPGQMLQPSWAGFGQQPAPILQPVAATRPVPAGIVPVTLAAPAAVAPAVVAPAAAAAAAVAPAAALPGSGAAAVTLPGQAASTAQQQLGGGAGVTPMEF